MKDQKHKLRSRLLFFSILMLLSAVNAQCPIIPKPTKAVQGKGQFQLDTNTRVVISSERLEEVASYLRYQILKHTSISFSLETSKTEKDHTIYLDLKEGEQIVEEEYSLSIKSNGINISGTSVSGIFYGTVSLLQLLLENGPTNGKLQISSWKIEDAPHYEWRGLMLDVSSFFIPEEKILSILDWMAFYKLNVFHWHLTDSTGWRLEILKYPNLALVGGIGNHFEPNAQAQYYTQQQINRIVGYAHKLNIKVIPEIDMPGHATAANKAYPEFSGGGSEKYPEFTFNPAIEGAYGYLTSILRETNVLFPSNMLHLGGDEVSFGNEKWGTDTNIASFMKAQGIGGLKDLEHYFMERMADSVFKMNAKVLAWDELAESNLPRDKTIIFWWRHDKPEQLKKALDNGFATVICPRIPYYFDFVQDEIHISGRKWAGAFSPIEAVYNFDVNTVTNGENYGNQILGIQGNLWTETVDSETRLDYLLFPRIAALSESSWTTKRNDYPAFEERLKRHLELYKKEGIYHYNPMLPNEIPEPVQLKKN